MSSGYDMCVLDADAEKAEVRWLLRMLYRVHPDTICLMVCQEYDSPFLLKLLEDGNLNNLIARHGGVSTLDDVIDETELMVTCQKLFRRDIFGLEKYLATWGIKVYEKEIESTEQKYRVMEDLDQFLGVIDCQGAIQNAVLLVADELIMNAIFNAPRDADGGAKYAHRRRNEKLELETSERVRVRWACDGKYVAVSVTDQFGALDRNVIIDYLTRCFGPGGAVMREGGGPGAGLGLYMVFNSITQLTFNIASGIATEVIALFYIRRGSRVFKASGRSLNIFILKGDFVD
jgi:hypothetical protein